LPAILHEAAADLGRDLASIAEAIGAAMAVRRLPLIAVLATVAGLTLGCALAGAARAGCSEAEFGEVIDAAGASLRDINAANAPTFDAKLETLRAKRGWSEAELPAQVRPLIQDQRILKADERVNELFGRINALGDEASDETPDCAKLDKLRLDAELLKETIEQKWALMFENLDNALKAGEVVAALPEPAPEPEPVPLAPVEPQAPEQQPQQPPWSAETSLDPAYDDSYKPPKLPPLVTQPQTVVQEMQSYTIDEIMGAGRGFFGSISTGLAGAIGYAFQQAGRPNGYILGKEGGGAVIAGLRYGEGRLNTKTDGSRKVFWQGPSIGYDLGASGGRTMILVYNLDRADAIFNSFGGVDGSAYLVGGVGITFMTDGEIVLAPIRSGLGLRLGANVGYLKFTPEATINPF
jgi:hypothetical protein